MEQEASVRCAVTGLAGGNLIEALNAAAAVIQSSIISRRQISLAFGEQIGNLGLHGGIFVPGPRDGSLKLLSVAHPSNETPETAKAPEQSAGQLPGASLDDFSFAYRDVEAIRLAIEEKRSVFIADTATILEQFLFGSTSPVPYPYLQNLRISRTICCPLISSGTVTGVIAISGKALSERNVPEITAFANHLSVALDNAELVDNLKRSETRFRELADALPLAVFETDTQGNFTFANATGLVWFGYTESDLRQGLNIAQTVVEKDRQRARENLQLAVSTKEPVPREYTAIRKTGGLFPVLISTGAIIKDGRLLGFRGIVLDISEQKRMETVLQNTEKLESLGVLAGGIAHDFNNLLTGIFGYIQMAQLGMPADSDPSRNLGMAMNVFERARALTHQLLTFSKGGAPVKKTISIGSLLKETVRFAMSGSNLKVDLTVPGDLWDCRADDSQIGQVFDNILINARQAMPLGGSVTVAAENVAEPVALPPGMPSGRYVKISVRDQGCGIPQDILPRIFDPFFTTKEQGSGLGLATAFSIIKKHGGHITAESEQEKGAAFFVYLPAVCARTMASPDGARIERTAKASYILFVDDEDAIRAFVKSALEAAGHTVTLAIEGKLAIEKYQTALTTSHPFDLVILDLTIPGGMGGKDTLERLLKIDPSVRAIASSGYSNDPIIAEPQKFGFKAKLSKPYLSHQLIEAVEDLVADRR